MFTGTPVVQKVTTGLFRITGVSLDADAEGTIGLNLDPSGPAGPGEIDLLAPEWQALNDDSLQDMVSVLVTFAGPGTHDVQVTKTGTTHADFLIHLKEGTDETNSGEMEIYVRFH